MNNTTVPLADSMETDRYKAAFVFVTPDIAARWLARNDKNRSITPKTVDRYARDMMSGDWKFTGETFKFAADGTLLDGQHRLTAIVQSGCTVLALVVRGLDNPSQQVMDTGRRRSAADALTMREQSHAVLLASAARLCIAWNAGIIKSSSTQFLGETSHSEIIRITESDPYLTWAVDLASSCKSFPANPSAVAFAAWLAGQVNETTTEEFVRSVADFRTNGNGDPRHTLLRRLQTAKDQRERLTSIQQAWLIVRALAAYASGEQLRQLKMSSSSGPSPFPKLGEVL